MIISEKLSSELLRFNEEIETFIQNNSLTDKQLENFLKLNYIIKILNLNMKK